MIVDTQAHREWCLADRQEVRLALKVSPDTPEHLESKEIEGHKV